MIQLGKLEEIKDLREVWPHEALDFTKWLGEDENIAILSDAIGIEIEVEEEESSVGAFNVDIYASESGTDRKIIIENQLEDTDHDHLGKLITYASGKGADVVVWLVKHAREEHRAAIEWLNNRTDDKVGFFLCEIKLFKIGNSNPAVKFEVIESPNDWSKEIKKATANSPSHQRRLEYWTAFNRHAFADPKSEYASNFNQRKASTDHWMSLSIGSSACNISLLQIRKYNSIGVELYITDDKSLFDRLYALKDSIEADIGNSLDWRRLDSKKASRVLSMREANMDNEEGWPDQFSWLMDMAVKMKKTFTKHL